jgi:hypothetical protein
MLFAVIVRSNNMSDEPTSAKKKFESDFRHSNNVTYGFLAAASTAIAGAITYYESPTIRRVFSGENVGIGLFAAGVVPLIFERFRKKKLRAVVALGALSAGALMLSNIEQHNQSSQASPTVTEAPSVTSQQPSTSIDIPINTTGVHVPRLGELRVSAGNGTQEITITLPEIALSMGCEPLNHQVVPGDRMWNIVRDGEGYDDVQTSQLLNSKQGLGEIGNIVLHPNDSVNITCLTPES